MRPLAMQGVLSYTAQFPIPWRVLAVTAMFHGANAGCRFPDGWNSRHLIHCRRTHTPLDCLHGVIRLGESRMLSCQSNPLSATDAHDCRTFPPYPPSWQAEFYRLWEKGLTTRACTEMRAAWSMRQCRVPEGVADMRKIASPPPSLLLEGQRA